REAIETKQAFEREQRIVRPDGEERVLRSYGQPVSGDDGEVVRLVGVCQDVTELNRAERARRSAEVRFRNAFDHAPVGVALADLHDEGRFLAVNHGLVGIPGHSREDLLASSLDQLTLPDDRTSDASQRKGLLEGAFDTYTTERRVLHASGHQIWAEVSLSLAR